MSQKNCAFTCCNNDYVPHAIVSLKSVEKWNPSLDKFVIGQQFSPEMKNLLASYGIEFFEIDWSSHFQCSWEYPVECFYWFGVADLFADLGYKHAVYLDADVYCNDDISNSLAKVETVSGVNGGLISEILGTDYAGLDMLIGPLKDGNRIQSGVVFLNIHFLNKFNMLAKAAQLYKKCLQAKLPRKGDDSLFATLIAKYPQLKPTFLAPEYNKIIWRAPLAPLSLDSSADLSKPERTIFFHFTSKAPKPWDCRSIYPDQESSYFAEKWKHLAIDVLSKEHLKRHFPSLAKALSHQHLRFYWYPSSNVGDLLTPYFLKRAGYDPNAFSVNEKKIAQLDRRSAFTKRLSLLFSIKLSTVYYIMAVGSVVRLCGEGALVFGSGIRSRQQKVHDTKIRFVRGPLTRARYLESGVSCPAIYGDPGLLMPRMFKPKVSKEYLLGIIPHFTEHEIVMKAYKDRSDVHVIDMGCGDVEKVIRQILSCHYTVSSSLHGLVFSHAYGVATRHIKITENIFGDGIKFDDYYQGVGIKHDAKDLTKEFRLNAPPTSMELTGLANEKLDNFDDRRLWDSFFLQEDGAGFRLRRSIKYPF